MTDLELKIPGMRNCVADIYLLGAVEADTCRVWVVDPVGARVEREGPDLFEAFAAVRSALDSEGVTLRCNGSRVDVYPSAMQRQYKRGRMAYVLTYPRTKTKAETVDIFAEAPPESRFGTVEEQRNWFDDWRHTPFTD